MKKKIAVLFGGCSTEYEVSLQSAYAVICHMDRTKYEPVPIGLKRSTGQWFWYSGDTDRIKEDTWYDPDHCVPVYLPTDRTSGGVYYQEQSLWQLLRLDGALPVLHGKNGEDGTVQGALELAGIPVIGCGVLSSALCMDKDRAHRMAAAWKVRVPESFLIKKPCEEAVIREKAKKLGYPIFIKPVRSGSSFGITKVRCEDELMPAIELAFAHDDTVIAEETIQGREVGCAVMGTDKLLTGKIDEIELADGFFDYTEKYTLKTSKIHVPARVEEDMARRIQESALRIYRALGCSGFARVDQFLTEDGEIYFNEVNTIPGFTAHSRFPNMLKASGYTFEEIISHILEEGLSCKA